MNIDLNDHKYFDLDQMEITYKPKTINQFVNKINILAYKCNNAPLQSKKIYFKQLLYNSNNANKCIFLFKELKAGKKDTRDYFVKYIKEKELTGDILTTEIRKQINYGMLKLSDSTKSLEIDQNSPSFLFNNLETILTRITVHFYSLVFVIEIFFH